MVTKDEVKNEVFRGFPHISLSVEDKSLMVLKRGYFGEVLVKRSIVNDSVGVNSTSLQVVNKSLS